MSNNIGDDNENMSLEEDNTLKYSSSTKLMKERIERYFKQLTLGCEKQCFNRFCKSNEALKKYQWSTQECACCSYYLAINDKKGIHYCEAYKDHYSKDIKYFDIDILNSILKEPEEIRNEKFIQTIKDTFSRSSNVILSFIMNPMMYRGDDDIGIDMDQVEKFYKVLLDQPEEILDAFDASIEKLTQALVYSSPNLSHVSYLRQFIILYEYPRISDPIKSSTIFGPLLIATAALPKNYFEILKDKYFKYISNSKLKDIFHDIQNFITLHQSVNKVTNLHTDKHITSATKVMQIVYELNNERKIFKYDQFYNETINNHKYYDIEQDYFNWVDKIGFSFCNYPFILNPENKSIILNIENKIEQRNKRFESFRWRFQGYRQSPYLEIKIDRNDLIKSSLTAFALYEGSYDLRKELKVEFIGEEGIDEGGVQKEWFHLLVSEIFDSKYGMFITDTETRTQWFNMASTDYEEYELLGKVLGLAVYNGVILDLHFPTVIYKKLMDIEPELEDLKQINPQTAKSLELLLEYDEEKENKKIEDAFGVTFQVSVVDAFGERYDHELIENGKDILVNKENREEFVKLYVRYLLVDSIKHQFESFKKGFKYVCDSEAFNLFRYEELELLICGSPVLDFYELEKTTTYNGYTKDDPTIKYFWEVIHELSIDLKRRFLFFLTGSDRSPIGGLGRLGLIISKHGNDENRLPSAQTCFNYLFLPPFKSKELLKKNLLLAIEHTEGFGLC